jgi:hypothetical protein
MHVHPPPPQPERLVVRKDLAVGNKKKMKICLPKHNYKLDNNLLTVEPRAVDPHCFDGGVGQPKMCIPPGKILGTPLQVTKMMRIRIRMRIRIQDTVWWLSAPVKYRYLGLEVKDMIGDGEVVLQPEGGQQDAVLHGEGEAQLLF